jgi:hypothetical protein
MSSGPAGIFYRDTHTLKDTLGNKTQMNLSNMLRHQNLLEEDGIEDLHFYFVQFNLHKRMILGHQRNKSLPAAMQDKHKLLLQSQGSYNGTVQEGTIESCDGELF